VHRGTTTEISLSALSHNLSGVRRLCGNRPVIAVVKADAYGHGAVEVSRRLLRDGASFLAVAFAEEARELREASLACPILVLFDPDVREVLAQDGIPVIADMRVAEALSRETGRAGRSVGVHVKVDTGMGRLGLRGDVAAQVLSLSRLPGISVEGVMTHLSDADLSDPVAAGEQIRRFRSLQTALAGAGLKIPCLHMANSAAVLALPEAHFDAVRPGLLLYGCWPLEEAERASRGGNASFEPAMTVKARILSLRRMPAGSAISYGGTFKTKRDSLIAVISAGYADGYSRAFSNRAQVIAGGTRAPVVGRVCMDLTMIDVTGIEGLSEGDEVVLLGRQGEETISASELSSHAATIPYEILTSLGGRARRKLYDDQVP